MKNLKDKNEEKRKCIWRKKDRTGRRFLKNSESETKENLRRKIFKMNELRECTVKKRIWESETNIQRKKNEIKKRVKKKKKNRRLEIGIKS